MTTPTPLITAEQLAELRDVILNSMLPIMPEWFSNLPDEQKQAAIERVTGMDGLAEQMRGMFDDEI